MSEDSASILQLMNDYCRFVDAGELEAFANLFEHATFCLHGDKTEGQKGSAAVLEMLQNVVLYDGKPLTKHVMTNVQIDVDLSVGSAKAQSYITVFQAIPPDFPLQAIFIGHYFDLFEKISGNWRFCQREISPDLVGDLSRHRADLA